MKRVNKRQALIIAVIVLTIAVAVLSVACYTQYEKIELHNLMALHKSYYFVQAELVERSGEYDEEEWNRCVNYLIMTGGNYHKVREGKFGDYNKVASIISLLTNIEEEHRGEALLLLRTLKVSWNTTRWQYGVTILEGDAQAIIKRMEEIGE